MRNLILVLAISLLGACTLLLGKTYQRLDPVPGVYGVIYLYPSAKSNSLQSVYIDKDPSTDGVTDEVNMVHKGYFPFLVEPGLVRVLTGSQSNPGCALVAVTQGSSHWVRVSSKDPKITVVAQAEAEKEMGSYREISRESRSSASGTFRAEECPMLGEQF